MTQTIFKNEGRRADSHEKAFETARVKDGTEQDFVLTLRERGGYLPALALELDGSQREALLLAPLSVALEYRGRGLGQRLMKEAFQPPGTHNSVVNLT